MVWCIAAAINALIWTEIFQLGSWLSGCPASMACLLAIFLTITAFGFLCQMLIAGGGDHG